MAEVPARAALAVVRLELTVRPPAMLDQRAGLVAALIPGLREAGPFDTPVTGIDEVGVCAHELKFRSRL
jgi:hypothetical protein